MKSFTLAILLIAFSSIATADVTKYKCASDLKLDTCYLRDEQTTTDSTTTTIYVDACHKGKVCQGSTFAFGSSQCVKVNFLLQEGEKCESPSECVSGKCENKKCKSIEDGAACEDTNECKIGSYCKNDVCAKYLAKGADCSGDSEGCRPGLVCSNNVCVPLFSLDNGEKSGPDSGCKSGHSYYNNDGYQCGIVKSVTACTTGASSSEAVITFASDVTVSCDCDSSSGCAQLQNDIDTQEVYNKYIEEVTDRINDILEDEDVIENYKITKDANSFGIKKLKELYVEYAHYDEIALAESDDDKDCVRDYFIRQMSSNKLYLSFYGLVLLALSLL